MWKGTGLMVAASSSMLIISERLAYLMYLGGEEAGLDSKVAEFNLLLSRITFTRGAECAGIAPLRLPLALWMPGSRRMGKDEK